MHTAPQPEAVPGPSVQQASAGSSAVPFGPMTTITSPLCVPCTMKLMLVPAARVSKRDAKGAAVVPRSAIVPLLVLVEIPKLSSVEPLLVSLTVAAPALQPDGVTTRSPRFTGPLCTGTLLVTAVGEGAPVAGAGKSRVAKPSQAGACPVTRGIAMPTPTAIPIISSAVASSRGTRGVTLPLCHVGDSAGSETYVSSTTGGSSSRSSAARRSSANGLWAPFPPLASTLAAVAA